MAVDISQESGGMYTKSEDSCSHRTFNLIYFKPNEYFKLVGIYRDSSVSSVIIRNCSTCYTIYFKIEIYTPFISIDLCSVSIALKYMMLFIPTRKLAVFTN